MEFLLLGFFTSLSLILAIGPQNVFVIEQGLKKQYVFLVCLICSISDCIFIFVGIFLFHYFSQYFNSLIELFAKKIKSSINQQLFNGGVAQLVRARDS